MKPKFRGGQKIYVHGRNPGKIRKKMIIDNVFHYVVEETGQKLKQYKENEISFFRE